MGDILSRTEQEQLEEAIATGDIEIPTSDSVQRLYVMQEQLFEKLKQEQEANNGVISSSTLQNFVQNNTWDSYDFIYYANKYFAKKDVNTMALLLAYFPSNNVVDDNYFKYYSTQYKELTSALNSYDKAQIFELANKCPFTNGNVVYAARNMYNRLTKQNLHFKNSCSNTPSVARQQKENTIVRKPLEIGKAQIYPNPSNGIVNIKLGLNNKERYEIKIIDMLGSEIASKNTSDIITTLNLGNRKGIYFVRIYNVTTGKVQIEKLILQ